MGYETAASTKMLSTSCVLCNRPLRDAESVQAGVGPICKKKYLLGPASSGAPDWERFDELLKTAPSPVRDRVESLASSEREDNHRVMNVLIHLAGAKWEEGDEDAQLVIASVSELAGALGYGGVRDKLVSRYIEGEREGPRVRGIVIEQIESESFDEHGHRSPEVHWSFHFPGRLGRNVFRTLARKLDAAGAWIERGDWSVNFVYSEIAWLKVINSLIPELSGTIGVLPSGETFVVPAEPLDVPAEPGGQSEGPPREQTGVDGFDELPPVDPESLSKGTEVQLRDGTRMFVRWFRKQNGEWRVGLAQSMQQKGGYLFVGISEVRTSLPSREEQDEVEETTGGQLSQQVASRELPEEMFPYQREGALWLDAKGSGILGFEPGLGKTLTSLAVCDTPVLVICPAGLRVNWLREVIRWRPDLSVGIVGMKKRRRGTGWTKYTGATLEAREKYLAEVLKADVVVANYEALLKRSTFEAITEKRYRTLIVDECHRLKELQIRSKKQPDGSWQSMPSKKSPKTASAVWLARQKTERAFLLTGTPMINGRHYELFPLLHMVAPETSPFRTFRQYCKQFCPPYEMHVGGGRYVTFFDNNQGSAELHELISGTYLLRKTKDELDLPEKQRRSIYVELDQDTAVQYERAALDFLNWIEEVGGAEAAMRARRAEAITKMTNLRRLSAIGKVPVVAEQIVSHLSGTGRPLVVMCHHREGAQALAGFFEALNEGEFTLGGGLKLDRKIRFGMYGWGNTNQDTIDHFQSGWPEQSPPDQREYLDVFIGSILACREGINLFRASDTFFLERDWRPMICVQAEDRIHRIGQKNKCTITYFEGSGTIDAKLAELLIDKTSTAAAVIDGRNLSEEEAAYEVLGEMFGQRERFAANPDFDEEEDFDEEGELDWVHPD